MDEFFIGMDSHSVFPGGDLMVLGADLILLGFLFLRQFDGGRTWKDFFEVYATKRNGSFLRGYASLMIVILS